ncbi:MAG: DUF2520 domain-containing protein [Actinomycetota bacterium]|nr:DUF2520 domain-containing protein [Actinomycetota bacterium]
MTIVGPGRVGHSIADAAVRAGLRVELLGRDFDASLSGSKTVLICVPDQEIERVADQLAGGAQLPAFTGHTSGATRLDVLDACQTDGAFSLHPLQTVPTGSTDLNGCPAACAGSGPAATGLATALARTVGMLPFEIEEKHRAIYHAAASMASNYLVTLEQTAAGLLGEAGVENPRAVLAPLVTRTLANWEKDGAEALTGPIVRGDESTVETHRRALAAGHPEVLPLYDALAERTRAIAATGGGAG